MGTTPTESSLALPLKILDPAALPGGATLSSLRMQMRKVTHYSITTAKTGNSHEMPINLWHFNEMLFSSKWKNPLSTDMARSTRHTLK